MNEDLKRAVTIGLSLRDLVALEKRLAKIEYQPGISKIIDYTSAAIRALRELREPTP